MSDLLDDEFYEEEFENDLLDASEFEDEFDEDAEIDDDGFTVERKRRRAHSVSYRVVSVRDLRASLNEKINQLTSIIDLTREQVLGLYRYFKWNRERLLERYIDAPEESLQKAGVGLSGSKQREVVHHEGTCEICYDEGCLPFFSAECDHEFCLACYRQYLDSRISEGESVIQCPEESCTQIVSIQSITKVLDEKSLDRYHRLLDRSFVDDNDHLRWCPAPDCEFAIECHVTQASLSSVVPTVTCNCGKQFCFGCGHDNHQPTICPLVKIWLQKCQDDSETANWIHANTKECPKCSTTIEKNGGCNHMTCKKCKYEFCWVCLGPWTEHGNNWYTCNRYEEKSSTSARDSQSKSRASLERYLHYYNRFANHEQSAKLDHELYEHTHKRMTQMQVDSNLSWVEVQFLKNAVDILFQCRQTLKWTYAFAYYLARNNQTEIFEDNQRDLELAVENLSELCERPCQDCSLSVFKQRVLDKTVYVRSRRDVLLDDTARGLAEGRWEYVVDV
ncbi:E3 ubiquitin-protein ligase dbl4 [Schizosaccharomyces pombe]|uniref:E3 ubiquitin-protein ligase dbl4 n=1 Tax=Schizosaccharomyces pombe (strain 972 / ATCC 24843) TaxID=284812 RepID=HEL1_SCHPO|nr:RING finger protein [Schizosaccharomyces pombe]Q9P3U4.1 RecName: Full=E3 ubiquitin-protein ligase dbl4; AltName: Full=DNA-break-localizing protein 4; AltName: Full=Histone E3 ligase 1; AltName: Full=RING-type E3 ubiquitin transferase dbl4 [Schizosaccharomyces pombe 972h-]CAB95997.1 ubiquitin-protein ligase involved in sporulation [Schizosaccharomyces pombe]|eukprot:NP_594204.1 RING finger protein [Schizosaccharomyces pombe]